MSDILTKEERSHRMKGIKTQDTAPELVVRRFLHAQGFRFRLHDKRLPGSPDIVLSKFKTLIFVQGCFWHRHGVGCSVKARVPKSNNAFWVPKLERNVQRDIIVQAEARKLGWNVYVVWECELRLARRGTTLFQLSNAILDSNGLGPELPLI